MNALPKASARAQGKGSNLIPDYSYRSARYKGSVSTTHASHARGFSGSAGSSALRAREGRDGGGLGGSPHDTPLEEIGDLGFAEAMLRQQFP